MVANAERLKNTLISMGFVRENILTLYDDKAQSYLFTARDIRIVVAELHALADRRRCL